MRYEALSARERMVFTLLRSAGWLYYAARLVARFASGRHPVRIRRILVARRARLGDLVVLLPTLAALRRRYPEAHVTLGVQPTSPATALLARSRDIDEILILDHLDRETTWRRIVGALELFGRGWDVVISGTRHFVMREALLCGAPYRLGLDDGEPLQRLNTQLMPLDPLRHESDNNLRLAEMLGCTADGEERVPALLPSTPEAERWVSTLLGELGVPKDARIVGLHAGAQKPSRHWPVERFAELARRLLARDPRIWILLTGGRGEEALAASLLDALPRGARARQVIGRTDLETMIALLRRMDAFVCNDTGVMHMARASGAPLLALLGPENDLRWGPYPAGRGRAISIRHEVPCAPCSRWTCGALYCLRALAVDEAERAVAELLEDRPDSGGALDRRAARHSWADLHGLGFLPPVVRLMISGAHAAEPVMITLRSLAAQAYPRVETVVAADGLDASARGDIVSEAATLRLRVLLTTHEPPSARQPWVDDDGHLVYPIDAGRELGRDELDEVVARAVREADGDWPGLSVRGEWEPGTPGLPRTPLAWKGDVAAGVPDRTSGGDLTNSR